jgi:3-phosphoshikimate 1-carboxyvinyltransferase
MDQSLNFVGALSSSKSLYNRALIAQSFFPTLNILGQSNADDVLKMKAALELLKSDGPKVFDCGEGGTVLRFLALRLSREKGSFQLTGHRKLFQRPQEDLIKVLAQLDVAATLENESLYIESTGWRPQGDTLMVPCGKSSQFLSAVALSSWNLPFDLYVSPQNFQYSRPYFYMTQRMLERLGMRFRYWSDDFCILKNQVIDPLTTTQIEIEPDLSSCFSLAAVAAVSGQLALQNFPTNSLQPDVYFVEVMKAMGTAISVHHGVLKVSRTDKFQGVSVNLKASPDLFPVLSALCALAESPSELRGAPHLQFKESPRIDKMAELLLKLGCEVKVFDDGINITPKRPFNEGFEFDVEDDHRLAMAAGVLLKGGAKFTLRNKEAVVKSFPDFWSAIQ